MSAALSPRAMAFVIGTVIAGDRRGRELFPILICIVAVVLGTEQVLANRFYKG